LVVLRADSAFYTHDVIATAGRAKVHFSITARINPAVRRAISGIGENAWIPFSYPNAVWDEAEQRLMSEPRSPKSSRPRSPAAAAVSTSAAVRWCAAASG
jgi:hypothetical protein